MRRMLYTNESFHQYSTTRHTSQWTLKPFAYPCCFRVLFLNFECERFRGKTTAPLPSGSASRRNVNSSIYGLPFCFSRISSQLKAEITAAAKQCSAHSRLVVMTSITLLIRHVVTQVGPPGLTFSVLHALLAFPIINNEEATELGTGPMNKKTTKKKQQKNTALQRVVVSRFCRSVHVGRARRPWPIMADYSHAHAWANDRGITTRRCLIGVLFCNQDG